MAFSNTIQLTTLNIIPILPTETSVFRLSSANSTWRSTLPLEPSTFLWQISSPSTGSWNDLTTWTTSTTSFLLTSTEFDNCNFRILENRKNSTVSLTSIGLYERRFTLQPLPSSDNIELWLDATKGLYNGLSALSADNSSVALWSDLSRKERNPIQSVVNNFPTLKTNVQNGNNVLRFNGTSQFLQILNSTATFNFMHNGTKHTVFMIVKAGNSTNPNAIYTLFANNRLESNQTGTGFYYDDRSGIRNNAYLVTLYTPTHFTTGPVLQEIIPNVFTPNTYNLITSEIDPSNAIAAQRSTTYFNITNGPFATNTDTAPPQTTNAPVNLTFGQHGNNGAYLNGDLCEIIVYRGILQTSERQTVENYLKTKWGTS